MLGVSSHAWKVNFCKFTNETRNGLEDSSKHDGLKFLAAVNGSCAGGGYELALACDEIILIDDRSSAVSLPEVPLLGVLPGTGGLTRLTDKRHVRHDLADVFCTTSEGVRGEKAVAWRLVDSIAKPAQFEARVKERALALATSATHSSAKGVALTPIERIIEADALRYTHATVTIDRAARAATFVIKGPTGAQPQDIAGDRGGRSALVPARARPRARRCDPVDAHERTRHRPMADENRGRPWFRSRNGRDAPHTERALVRTRNDRLSAPNLEPARRHFAQPVRACRRGLVLRWDAARNRARLRPHLSSRLAERPDAQTRADRNELRRLSDGERPEPRGAPLLRRGAGA